MNDIIGKRVLLIYMEDNFAVPPNTKGTITNVDDMNVIHVKWDNGSTLGLLPELDKYVILDWKQIPFIGDFFFDTPRAKEYLKNKFKLNLVVSFVLHTFVF